MNKFSELIIKINSFSIDAHWEYKLAKFAKDTQTLLAQADEFDIKDEELFNQFESFINAYRELIATLGISSDNLSTESFEEAAQLIDTLKTRYDRIIKNPYLNAGSDEGYEEDFDPGTFTQFLNDVAQDAENKLKSMAGEDIDISEMRAAQYAREFNTIDEEYKGTKEDAWSAERVQRALEARRNWFRNLMLKKKLNINDPDYQKYIESRRQSYQLIVSDPERRENYRQKAKARQAKFRKKLDMRKKEIIQLLSKTRDSKKIQELQKELQSIEESFAHKKEEEKQKAVKVKQIKEAKDLLGLTVHLQQKIASLKSEVVKSIKDRAKVDPIFVPYKKAVEAAKNNLNQDPSPTNQAALENAIKQEADALKKYLDNHPKAIEVRAEIERLYAYRDKCKQLNELGWLSNETVPEETKPYLHEFIAEGESLISEFGKYRGIVATLTEIINFVRSRL